MPNLNWSELTPLQLGRYAEYYAKMEFTSYGFEVYSSEVDDHGVDFIIKSPKTNNFFEVQVKSVRDYGYVFISKSKMPELTANRLICYLHFQQGQLPDIFIIPALVWCTPNAVFVDRKYDKPGQKSAPEWGINISKKNFSLLEPYQAEVILRKLRSF